MKGTLKTMIPDIEIILQDLKTQFLEPVFYIKYIICINKQLIKKKISV